MDVSAQAVANILHVMQGVNASELELPTSLHTQWTAHKWCDQFTPHIDNPQELLYQLVNGGVFLAYQLTVDGHSYTLMTFAWDQGGYDGAILTDGHPTSVEDAAYRWLGDTLLEEYPADHHIREVIELPPPEFSTLSDYPPGVYSAEYLNPPSGEDCTHILVRADGSLGWCDADGLQSENMHGDVSCFTIEDLCDDDVGNP